MSGPIPDLGAIVSGLGALSGTGGVPASPSAARITGTAQGSFLDTLKVAVDRVDGTVANAGGAAQAFSAGDRDISLSDVMVSLEQANLAFQTAATVRDKVADAYTTIMNMQI